MRKNSPKLIKKNLFIMVGRIGGAAEGRAAERELLDAVGLEKKPSDTPRAGDGGAASASNSEILQSIYGLSAEISSLFNIYADQYTSYFRLETTMENAQKYKEILSSYEHYFIEIKGELESLKKKVE